MFLTAAEGNEQLILLSQTYFISHGHKQMPLTRGLVRQSDSGFPGSSVGKESTCNAGEPGSIPESGRSPGEGIGYPLQYS